MYKYMDLILDLPQLHYWSHFVTVSLEIHADCSDRVNVCKVVEMRGSTMAYRYLIIV